MGEPRRIFAITTRGLEAVSAGELERLSGVTVDRIGYRRVAATCTADLAALLALRTVDDVFLDVAEWSGIGRLRSTLARLGALSAGLDLREAADRCAEVRPLRAPPFFSITANFVGKRNYSTGEIKSVCADGIATRHGWAYVDDDAEADLNVRLFVEHDTGHVGVRLGKTSLHRRPYKRIHVPGSLKPPVAAALLSVVELAPGMRVLDPCCGAGTILIEAGLYGAQVRGGDVDATALDAARTNALAAGVPARLGLWDAQSLPLADGSVDRVVSNLPWGRQAEVDTTLRAFYRRACGEMARVLRPGGRVALLTNGPRLVDFQGLDCEQRLEISLFGQTPTTLIYRKGST